MLDRRKAKWLGIATITLAVGPYLILPAWLLAGDLLMMPMLILLFIVSPVVLVISIVLLVRAEPSQLAGGVMWPWLLLVILGGAVGQAVSWYLNFWRPLSAEQPPARVEPPPAEPEPLSVGQIAARARLVQYGKPVDPADVQRALADLEDLRARSEIAEGDYATYRKLLAGV